MSERLKYDLSFYEGDLVGDIHRKLEDKFQGKDSKKLRDIAKKTVEELKTYGNGALYWGMVLYGTEEAIKTLEREG